MKFMGTQPLPGGRSVDGYHCQNPECKYRDSWQSVTVGAQLDSTAMLSRIIGDQMRDENAMVNAKLSE